jgi:hypothetical protein
MSDVAIHMRLIEIFGHFVMAYSWMTRIARSSSWTGNSSARLGRPPNEQFDELILGAFEKGSIASVRQIADMTRILSTIVLDDFNKSNAVRFTKMQIRAARETETMRATVSRSESNCYKF